MSSSFHLFILLGIFVQMHSAKEPAETEITSSIAITTTTSTPTTISTNTTSLSIKQCCSPLIIFSGETRCEKCYKKLCKGRTVDEKSCAIVQRTRDVSTLINQIKDKRLRKNRGSNMFKLSKLSNDSDVEEWIKKYLFPGKSSWSDKTTSQLEEIFDLMMEGVKYMCYQRDDNGVCKFLFSQPSPLPKATRKMADEFAEKKCAVFFKNISAFFEEDDSSKVDDIFPEDVFTMKICRKVIAVTCVKGKTDSPPACDKLKCVQPYMLFVQEHYGPDRKEATDKSVLNNANDFTKITANCNVSNPILKFLKKHVGKDLEYIKGAVREHCYSSYNEKCSHYTGGEFQEFGRIIISEFLHTDCSDPEPVLENQLQFAFCSRLEEQTGRTSTFTHIRQFKDKYVNVRSHIMKMDVIEDVCRKLFQSDILLENGQRKGAFKLFFDLLRRHKSSYEKAVFYVCAGHRFIRENCEYMDKQLRNGEREKSFEKCIFTNKTELLKACQQIASFHPNSKIRDAWNGFMVFRNDSYVVQAAVHRGRAKCEHILAKCKEFDQKTLENKKIMTVLTIFFCSAKQTMTVCHEYLDNWYAQKETEYTGFLNNTCNDTKVLLSEIIQLDVCKNIYKHDCQKSKRIYCESMEFIAKLEHTVDERNITSRSNFALNMYFRDSKNASLLAEKITTTAEGMIEMIRLACEKSVGLHRISMCLWVLKNFLLTSNNERIKLLAMEHLCLNAERRNVFKYTDTNTCRWLWETLCGSSEMSKDGGNNLHCVGHDVYLETIRNFAENKQNISAIHQLLRAKCERAQNILDNLSCNITKGMLQKNEKLLKRLMVRRCNSNKPPTYCKDLCQKKADSQPRFIEQQCFRRFLQIVESGDEDEIVYCNLIKKCSLLHADVVAEFNTWKTLTRKLVGKMRDFDAVKAEMKGKMGWYIETKIENTDLRNRLKWEYYGIVFFHFKEFRRGILHRVCVVTQENCVYWLKKFHEKNLYLPSYEDLCKTKHQQTTKLCANMHSNCKLVQRDCSKITAVYLNVYFNPLACQQQATTACTVFVEEFCMKRNRDFRCKILFDRMGPDKIIDLMPQCETEKNTRTCNLIFDALKASHSTTLIAKVFQGYCTGDTFHGIACNRIKNFCFDVPKVGCYDVMQVYYPFWMDILVFCMEMSIFALIWAVILFLKRRRNHRRIMEAQRIRNR